MAAGLYDALIGSLRPALVGAAGSLLDEHDIGVKRGLESSVIAILGALNRAKSDAKTMNDVSEIVSSSDNDPATDSDPAALLKAGPQAPSVALGSRLNSTLFGDRQTSLVRAIARASGISVPSAATLFSVAAPIVLGQLGRRTSTQGSTPGSLNAVLSADADRIVSAVPPYMRPLLGMPKPDGQGLFDGTLEGGLRSALLLAVPLLFILGIFWYVLPPLQGHVDVKVPETPPVLEGKLEYRDEWRRDPTPTTTAPNPSDSKPGTTAEVTPPPPAKAPPIAGLVRMTLPDGVDIDVVPFGLEQKAIAFVEDRYSAIDKTRWFDFDRLRFLSGSTELTPGSRAQLRNVAKILKAYPNVNIKIGGYTDNVGNPDANMRLSDGRAKSAMNQLIKLGVAPERLEAEGYGELHPIADNATAEGRAKNRRTALSVRAK